METGVSRHSKGVGAEALTKATGKAPSEWLAILDARGATKLTHTEIARWLSETYAEVDGWWVQSITVMYEQERGMRAPGQMADGTFSVSVTRSVQGDQQRALDVAIGAFEASLGAPVRVSRDAKYPSAAWKNAKGEHLLARIAPTRNGRSGISMTHSKIADASEVAAAKQSLADALDKATDAT